MPQSLHILSAHIIFSTEERQPWLPPTIRKRVWAYQSRILQNLECNSITIGGMADHVHVLCNLTKKFPTAKVLEILKKDSSKLPESDQYRGPGQRRNYSSHSCNRFKRKARSDFVSASSKAFRNCSTAAWRLFKRRSNSRRTA